MTDLFLGATRAGASRAAGGLATAGAIEKRTTSGTHRVRLPAETLEWVRPHLAPLGITRVANVTGLDVVGIPVVMVTRPNARGLSVSQGKGITLDAAKASGVMESIELWHAEHLDLPLWRASAGEVERRSRLLRVDDLPRAVGGRLDRGLQLLWVEGTDVTTGEPVWLPEEIVGTDCSLPRPPGAGCFVTSSNGLASGNHLLEALVHGLSEVVERDAKTVFELRPATERRARRIDLDSVDDPDCRDLLERCAAAGVAVAAWDLTTDLGIAAVGCEVFDRDPNPWRPLPIGAGSGCHPAREVAFARALTEAAQSRLTVISGARDDIGYRDYERATSASSREHQRSLLAEPTPRAFADLPSHHTTTIDADVDLLVGRLAAAGLDEVVAVDLTRPELDIPVVRVVVPGLEHRGPAANQYRPGPRGRAVMHQEDTP